MTSLTTCKDGVVYDYTKCKVDWANVSVSPMYSYNPYINWNSNYYSKGTTMTMNVSYENFISEAKVVTLAAYGLRHDEVVIKEIDGKLTVKSNPIGKKPLCSTLNLAYTLKNVTLKSSTLSLGVLTLEFVDNDNVTYHKVNEVE